MKHRILALILCLIFVLPLLSVQASALTPTQASDVDEDGTVTARDAAILARYVAGWEGYVDVDGSLTYPWKTNHTIKIFDPDHPVDLGGRTFRFLTHAGSVNSTNPTNPDGSTNFTTTHFSIKDVCPWRQGDPSDSSNYARHFTMISEVVETRNRYLETTYNCKIEEVRSSQVYTDLKTDILSGAGEYDFATLPVQYVYSHATTGYLQNFRNISTIDLTASWFDQRIGEQLTFQGALYYLTGASDSALSQSIFLPMIGLTNVQKSYGFSTVKQAADFIYDLVLNGKWTIDKMYEVVTNCYAHYTGSSAHYGVTAENHGNKFHMLGMGVSLSYEKDGRITFYDNITDAPNFTQAWSALRRIMAPSDPNVLRRYGGTSGVIYNGTTSVSVIYCIGSPVYAYTSQYSSASYYMAPLPYPKLTEDAAYITQPNQGFSYLYTISAGTAYRGDAREIGFENGTDMAGYFLSAYFEASQNHTGKDYSVADAYWVNLASKAAFHNAEYGGRPLQVMQMIRDSVVFDPGYALAPTLYSQFDSCGNNQAGDNSYGVDYTGRWDNIASSYKSAVGAQKNNVDYTQDFLALGY